jgi:formate-dependent nitrite reductase membrane component NrfD
MNPGVPQRRQDRVPDYASEARLLEIRREAEQKGAMKSPGIRPAGAPFPVASAETGYYGIPLLKEPQWKWEVPVYFFVGGAAGAAAVVAGMARYFAQDEKLVQDARWIAAIGGVLSPALLVADLGVPSRFLNMLRVFKFQSPMSMGSWILSAFSSAAAATVFAGMLRDNVGDWLPIRMLENAGEALATTTGLFISNYTGVLIGATAIPVWNKNVSTLPIHFGASGLGSAVALLELAGHSQNRALNTLGIGSALVETLEGAKIELTPAAANLPLKRGSSGWLTRTGGVLSGPLPLLLRMLAGGSGKQRSRRLRRTAALATIVGSFLTRVAWLRAGHTSARNFRLPLELPGTARDKDVAYLSSQSRGIRRVQA